MGAAAWSQGYCDLVANNTVSGTFDTILNWSPSKNLINTNTKASDTNIFGKIYQIQRWANNSVCETISKSSQKCRCNHTQGEIYGLPSMSLAWVYSIKSIFKRDKEEIKSPQTCSPFSSLEETQADTWHKISKAGSKIISQKSVEYTKGSFFTNTKSRQGVLVSNK